MVFDDLIPKTGIPTSKNTQKKVEISRKSLYHTKRIDNVKKQNLMMEFISSKSSLFWLISNTKAQSNIEDCFPMFFKLSLHGDGIR